MARIPAYPGYFITLRESGIVAVPTEAPTDRLLIIGMALDGPVNAPVRVTSAAEASRIFGPVVFKDGYKNPATGQEDGKWSGNTLVRAASQAFANGATNVWLMRVGGTTAKATGVLTGAITGTYNLDLIAVAPGAIYNEVTVSATTGTDTLTITINQPAYKGGTVQFSFPTGTTIGDVLNTVNASPLNQTVVFAISPSSPSGVEYALTLPCSSMTFASTNLNKTVTGANGTRALGDTYATSVTGLYNLLVGSGGAFEQAKEYPFDVAVLDGLYADDIVATGSASGTTSIYTEFAKFIYQASKNHPCHGVLGLSPIQSLNMSSVRTFVENSYLSTSSGVQDGRVKFGQFIKDGGLYTDPDTGETVQLGRQVSVVAGLPVVMEDPILGAFIDTPHVIYAARIAYELPGKSFVYYQLPGIRDVIHRSFPADLTKKLVLGVGANASTNTVGGGGYVVIRNLPQLNDRIVVVSDVTTSKRDHSYSTLSVARTVNAAVRLVKSVTSQFIGQPNRVEVHSAMATAIRGVLNRLAEAGALLGGEGVGYQFSIIPSGADLQLGEIKVVLDLVPAISIRAVRIEVNVSV